VVQQSPVVVELLLVLTLGPHTTVVGVVTLDVQVLQVLVLAVVQQQLSLQVFKPELSV
jgi:hypothetical protein